MHVQFCANWILLTIWFINYFLYIILNYKNLKFKQLIGIYLLIFNFFCKFCKQWGYREKKNCNLMIICQNSHLIKCNLLLAPMHGKVLSVLEMWSGKKWFSELGMVSQCVLKRTNGCLWQLIALLFPLYLQSCPRLELAL